MAKKVLFTSHTANFAKFNQPYMRRLREQGYIVDYASAGEEPVTGVNNAYTIPFARSPFALWRHWRAYRELRKLLRQKHYDLVHTHTPVGSVVTRMAVKGLKDPPKVIYTAHGLHFYDGASKINWALYYPVEKYLAKSTDTIVTINREDYERVQAKFRPGSVEQIHGVGVDLKKFYPVTKEQKNALRAEHGFEAKDFLLIAVAEFNKNKDQAFLIQNLPALREKIPNLQLILLGNGKLEAKLKQLAQKLGVARQVKFPGYQVETAPWYQMADVVVSASQREGLGLNLVEGMATGLPIVARDNRGHREIVTSTNNGKLFHSSEEYCEAILELYHFPHRRQEIGAMNAKAAEKFSLDKSLAKMDEVYRKYLD